MMESAASTDDAVLVHEASYRVRFDEAGPDGFLRTSALLRYAQDVAWLHSTARGFDRDWYRERGLTWLVRAAELEILAPVPMGTTIVSRTRVVGQRRVWARRRGEFLLADGTLAGWVHTDWVMIDARGALTRIPAIFGEVFRIPEASGQIGRVQVPAIPDGTPRHGFAVRPHELDPMDHANNAVYLDWLEEAMLRVDPGAARRALAAVPRRYRLEYAAAAAAGARLEDAAWRDGDPWHYSLTAAADEGLAGRAPGAEVFRATFEPMGGDR
ncbi:MAG TPA: acyl-ACP thioesterase domain-containing protein [Candidatus Limnocylindrales bacterium]|nr:acyl-ACP thioesterase domain-containing protein [Candidatus Limnocylindrales bacterium]